MNILNNIFLKKSRLFGLLNSVNADIRKLLKIEIDALIKENDNLKESLESQKKQLKLKV